jgi:hypothetical protein
MSILQEKKSANAKDGVNVDFAGEKICERQGRRECRFCRRKNLPSILSNLYFYNKGSHQSLSFSHKKTA